jgi:hypothetical protein
VQNIFKLYSVFQPVLYRIYGAVLYDSSISSVAMSTKAQVLANRENSLKSTGPRTAEGKLITSRNGISHGLASAGDPVLPHEDRNAFNALLKSYRSDFSPATEHENFLVTEMAGARWRLERAGRIESAMLEDTVDFSDDSTAPPEMQMAKAMMQKEGDSFARMDRHRANLERTYHRCAREFRAARRFENDLTAEQLALVKYDKLLTKLIDQLPPGYELRPKFVGFRSEANSASSPIENDERTTTNDGPGRRQAASCHV